MKKIIGLLGAVLLLATTFAAPAAAARNDNQDLNWWGPPNTTETGLVGQGAHTSVQRSGESVSVDVHARGLEPGNAYTVWLVTFNNPDGCVAADCTGDDVYPGGPAEVTVIWSGVGGVANGGGSLNGNGYLTEGNPQGYQQLFADLGAPDPGFTNAAGAEIHFVVRDHGPATGNPAQTSTFEGDCTPGSSEGLGSGAYECVDIQFSIHKA